LILLSNGEKIENVVDDNQPIVRN